MRDVQIQFDSNRMAEEYYEMLYKKPYAPASSRINATAVAQQA
jgi:hypothetical protein